MQEQQQAPRQLQLQVPAIGIPPAVSEEDVNFKNRYLSPTTAHGSHDTFTASVSRMVSLEKCATIRPQQITNEPKPRLVFSPILKYPYWYPNPTRGAGAFTAASSRNENTTSIALALVPLVESSLVSSPLSHTRTETDVPSPPLQQSEPPQSSSLQYTAPLKHRYMVVTMERCNLFSPWGLSITMLEDRFLIVGHVPSKIACNSLAPFIRKAWVSDSFATPTRFWHLKHDPADHMADVPTFVRSLMSEPPVETHDHVASIHSILRPGDVILAVAGLTLVQWDFSLTNITACLRQNTSVSLLVFRHPLAGYAAWQATSSNQAAQRVAEEALCAMRLHMGHLVPSIRMGHGGPASQRLQNTIASRPAAANVSLVAMNIHMYPTLPSPPQNTKISLGSRCMSTKNLLFRNDVNPEGISYCDDLVFEWESDSYHLFLPPIGNFKDWLTRRKAKWRLSYSKVLLNAVISEIPRNSLFESNQAANGTIYCDESDSDDNGGYGYSVSDPDDRIRTFVPAISNFSDWLARRKETWRQTYSAVAVPENWVQEDPKRVVSAKSQDVDADDFWTLQGFDSHAHWLTTRTAQWKLRYSWNRRKRQKLEHDVKEVVHLDQDHFAEWLHVRKNQWKVQRRKRQRERLEEMQLTEDDVIEKEGDPRPENSVPNKKRPPIIWIPSATHPQSGDLIAIDALLEDRERQQKAIENRLQCHQSSFNLSFLFDADLGCPDDTVTRIFTFLNPVEHSSLLSLSCETRHKLIERENVWRQLCPSHWQLPRRPRKPWHTIYWTQLQAETERYHKNWDELLAKASKVLLHRDELQVIEKMVTEAERDWKFSVDYVSSVVCERNSLLNLAVIHQRHKVARWLVEVKRANIESCDRGSFTALLNAAYAGDRYLVRFLMQRGADRNKVGRFHYTKPLSLGMGLTAEGWADKNGYTDVAKLLRYGL